jgi:hypothetical protein
MIKMRLTRKNLISIAVILWLVGLTLGSLALTQSRIALPLQTSANNDPSAPPTGELRGPPESPHPGILNTVDYALGVVENKVVVPDASRIGPSFEMIGVEVRSAPYNVTTSNGITFRNWILVFVISDKPFINGTTLNTELAGHIITVSEAVSTGYYNSHDAAVDYMTPFPICVTDLKTGEETGTPSEEPSPLELLKIRNTYLAVDPRAPNAYFSIDDVDRRVQISGDLSYPQLLALADSMIP